MNAPMTLTQLAAAWRAAKADEQAANARRLELEQEIVAAMGPHAVEGSTSTETDGLRIRVTWKLTRSVDSDALQACWAKLSRTAQRAFRWKAECKLKELHALQELAPDEYKAVTAFIETKPAKAGVTVEEIA